MYLTYSKSFPAFYQEMIQLEMDAPDDSKVYVGFHEGFLPLAAKYYEAIAAAAQAEAPVEAMVEEVIEAPVEPKVEEAPIVEEPIEAPAVEEAPVVKKSRKTSV